MAGTINGGIKVARIMKERYGHDYYATIGALGGAKLTDKPKGFAAMSREFHRQLSAKGGKLSRRGK
jgi:hypothetical protein